MCFWIAITDHLLQCHCLLRAFGCIALAGLARSLRGSFPDFGPFLGEGCSEATNLQRWEHVSGQADRPRKRPKTERSRNWMNTGTVVLLESCWCANVLKGRADSPIHETRMGPKQLRNVNLAIFEGNISQITVSSELLVITDPAQIYAAYISAGRVAVGKEDQ